MTAAAGGRVTERADAGTTAPPGRADPSTDARKTHVPVARQRDGDAQVVVVAAAGSVNVIS